MMRMLSEKFKIFFVIFSAFLCICCGKNVVDDRDTIAVSLEPQRFILEKLAGDKFRIVTVMKGGENPETYEPVPSKRIDVENSKIYFITGGLPFEQKLQQTSKNSENFVDVSSGIDLIYGTHFHRNDGGGGHSHRAVDPHVWTSVRNAKVMAANMARALIETDPENKDFYIDNLNRYAAHLDSLDVEFSEKLGKVEPRAFMVWHPSLSYFAKDYGLDQIAVSADTRDLSVAMMAEVIARAKQQGVKVMFFQKEYDNREAERINEGVGSRSVSINPTSYQWEDELRSVVEELSR